MENEMICSAAEAEALEKVWADLGPLFAHAISQLSREQVLALCRDVQSGAFTPQWRIEPGLARLIVFDRNEVVYECEFAHQPARFVFAEIGKSN